MRVLRAVHTLVSTFSHVTPGTPWATPSAPRLSLRAREGQASDAADITQQQQGALPPVREPEAGPSNQTLHARQLDVLFDTLTALSVTERLVRVASVVVCGMAEYSVIG